MPLKKTTPESKQPFLHVDTSFRQVRPSSPLSQNYPYLRRCIPSNHLLHKFWIIEAFSSALSLTLFVAIVLTLHSYDNDIFGSTSAVTESDGLPRARIFPLLAIMSAVMRASMLLPVATAIGQLKWSWYKNRRRLVDIERFDEASRGVTGSLRLLWTVRFRHLVAIGAALTILALPIDAVIQSAVIIAKRREPNTVPYPYPYQNETISNTANFISNVTEFPRATQYVERQTMESSLEDWATTEMINFINFGVSYMNGLGGVISADTKVNCPTGYCEFGIHQSLVVSHFCQNRSDSIVRIESQYPYLTIPGTDLKLYDQGNWNYTRMVFTAKSYDDYDPENFNGSFGPLIARTALLMNSWPEKPPVALECVLYWDIMTATGIVDPQTGSAMQLIPILNTTYDTEIDTDTNFTRLKPHECWFNNKTIAREDDPDLYDEECIYHIRDASQTGIRNLLLDEKDGLNGASILINMNIQTNETRWNRMNYFITNINNLVFTAPDSFLEDMGILFKNIALSMSHVIRNVKPRMINNHQREKSVTGRVYRYVFYYKVEWARLTLPAILVFSCTAFVVGTALSTKNTHDWRRSSLPLLFHGLTSRERYLHREVAYLPDMECLAKEMHVELVDTGEGPKLVAKESAVGVVMLASCQDVL